MRKTILDLAGGTGAWSQPWKQNFNVINVTLPEYDLTEEKTIQHFSNLSNVYGIFFACPCTVWSSAGNKYFKDRTPEQLFHHFRIFIGGYRIIKAYNNLAFWVIENPKGKMKYLLGKNTNFFHPYHFGDPYQKLTLLWGDFIMPQKLALTKPLKKTKQFKGSSTYRQETRSITPAGFAQAFYMVNNPLGQLKYKLASIK